MGSDPIYSRLPPLVQAQVVQLMLQRSLLNTVKFYIQLSLFHRQFWVGWQGR